MAHENSYSLLERQQEFWRRLHAHIVETEPRCPPVPHSEIDDLGINYEKSGSGHARPNRLAVSRRQRSELRFQHRAFVHSLRDEQYELPFIAKTRGIVTTAGGQYLPVTVVSVRILRETGCELPVEVFLATKEEWDSEICDHVFPQLNTKCMVLADIFDPVHQNTRLGIQKYQFKVMSVVFSSFEEVLFLDSDCFPIHDPTEHFTSDPFRQSGMIPWSDFWYPSESLAFFDIAEIPMPQINERPATESGQMFYSKSKHTDSLLLAMYYNFYGPDYYYPLQSQGAPGEGDKETFLWSAVALSNAFYSVHTRVKAMGYHTTDGNWRGSAMVQFDTVEDRYRQHQVKTLGEENANQTVRPLFAHVNFPKIDPGQVFLDMSFGATGPTRDGDGTRRRIWHKNEKAAVAFFGFDLERRLWSVVKEVACEYEGKFQAWNGLENICKQATDYWNIVFDNQHTHWWVWVR